MKRIFSLVMTLCLLLSLFTVAANATPEDERADRAANELHALGLFNGVGTNPDGSINYDLKRAMTREEGVTMLVRMLGKESEAKAGSWSIPFSDVSDWARPYVGYAYANGLTNGMGKTADGKELFGGGPNYTLTAAQYLTFVLRSLGYESGKDFLWDSAWRKTDAISLTNGEYSSANNNDFLRGDAVIVSLAAYKFDPNRIVRLANVRGKNYEIDSMGNMTIMGKTLYLENVTISGEVKIPSSYNFRRIILNNVNVEGTIYVDNIFTVLWTNGNIKEISISAPSCSITAKDSVKITRISGSTDAIVNTPDGAPSGGSMYANGDLGGISEGTPFTLGVVVGEDIIDMTRYSSPQEDGRPLNLYRSLLNKASTKGKFGSFSIDNVLMFNEVSTSYQSRISLGGMKKLNSAPVKVVEGALPEIKATRTSADECLVRTVGALNANGTYFINYGAYSYGSDSGSVSCEGPFSAEQLAAGVTTKLISKTPIEGKYAFISGYYVNDSGEVVLVDGYPAGVSAPY